MNKILYVTCYIQIKIIFCFSLKSAEKTKRRKKRRKKKKKRKKRNSESLN